MMMDDVEVLTMLIRTIEELDKQKLELEKRRSQLISETEDQIAHLLKDPELRERRDVMFSIVYWGLDDMPVKEIVRLFGGKTVTDFAIMPVPSGVCCRDCGTEIMARTRSHRAEQGPLSRCPACFNNFLRRNNSAYEAKQLRDLERQKQLTAMPYQEYLASAEWQEKRKWMLSRAGYRCQMCAATGGTLDVHHNHYPKRGKETERDLLVLCRRCHGIHHQQKDGGAQA